jgi:hypothetical protein
MTDALLDRFLDGTVELEIFDHEAHVKVTWLLLRDRPLPETMIALRDGLRSLAARAGRPEKYHETITFAMAALVNERMRDETWDEFKERNADLFSWRSVMDRFYDQRTLMNDEARRTFLLPVRDDRARRSAR